MSEISKICNFWPTSTYYTSKESIFHVEFNFIEKKYDFMQEKLKINNFWFFFQNQGWPIIFDQNFLKVVVTNFKSKLACTFERFWNEKSPKESSISLII